MRTASGTEISVEKKRISKRENKSKSKEKKGRSNPPAGTMALSKPKTKTREIRIFKEDPREPSLSTPSKFSLHFYNIDFGTAALPQRCRIPRSYELKRTRNKKMEMEMERGKGEARSRRNRGGGKKSMRKTLALHDATRCDATFSR